MAVLRRKGRTRSAVLLLICCEGAKTEVQYFEEYKSKSSRVHVAVISPSENRSAPSRLVQTAKAAMRALLFETGDQAWLVLDEDRWAGKQLAILHQEGRRSKLREARSNPNFHIWLLAHFEPIGSVFRKEEIDFRLRNHMSGFDKVNLKVGKLHPNVGIAIENSRTVDVERQVLPGCTRVYLLMEAISDLRNPVPDLG